MDIRTDQKSSADTNTADPGCAAMRLEHQRVTHRCARLALVAFLFTFTIARILVILIMAGKLPAQLFFHVSGTHVHHLNYGIMLLSVCGAFFIFIRPAGRALSMLAAVYGIGLGLTFDEFGMWLHLGGPYWQGTSFDAIIVIAAVLALVAYGSTIRRWEAKHHVIAILLVVVLCAFAVVANQSRKWAAETISPMLEQLEKQGPG